MYIYKQINIYKQLYGQDVPQQIASALRHQLMQMILVSHLS